MTDPLAHAIALHQQGLFDQAEPIYRALLQTDPQHFDALQLLAALHVQRGQYAASLDLFDTVLRLDPLHTFSRNNRGLARFSLGAVEEALADYDAAIAIDPAYADAINNRGNALLTLGRAQEALADFDQALALKPDYVAALSNRGSALAALGRDTEALAAYESALARDPSHAETHYNSGNLYNKLKREHEAIAAFRRALQARPHYPDALLNLGTLLVQDKEFDEGLACLNLALALRPDFLDALSNRGRAWRDLHQYAKALEDFDRVLAIDPMHVDALYNSAGTFVATQRYAVALERYRGIYAQRPDFDFLLGDMLHLKMQLCDWQDYARDCASVRAGLARGIKVMQPFPLLALPASRAELASAARIWVQDQFPPRGDLPPPPAYRGHDKIRIGFFSADFRSHALTMLITEMLELHDRARFEIVGFSFSIAEDNPMSRRIAAAFDRFITLDRQSDRAVALLAREMEIDIAVDFGGFTSNCRAGIFAYRAAPVQISFLGFLGTMAADYMDYMITDTVMIPATHRADYAEKLIYLPHYQVNDRGREISDRVFTRTELGLPPRGFVFCCFNSNYKITPDVFASWMRILNLVPDAVLWLLAGEPETSANLRKAAAAHGVLPERLVFASRVNTDDYLARYRAADLFLDTLPYNAGATASDALWTGLPVLTRPGETFASRMAASLLTAIGLPELIARDMDDYEALAVRIATEPDFLRGVKEKLAANRLTTPLFDSAGFTRQIEKAYVAVHQRAQSGLPPEDVFVTAGS